LGYIPEEDVPTLLSGAQTFVFISNYEGFGLPVIQAMACGTPVIASRQTCLPEVVGESGILVLADQPADLAQAIADLDQRPDLRKHYSELGLRRAQEYDWQKSADLTLTVIRGVI
jgi:glycosyltransferase involved in cell wall biosynthesis